MDYFCNFRQALYDGKSSRSYDRRIAQAKQDTKDYGPIDQRIHMFFKGVGNQEERVMVRAAIHEADSKEREEAHKRVMQECIILLEAKSRVIESSTTTIKGTTQYDSLRYKSMYLYLIRIKNTTQSKTTIANDIARNLFPFHSCSSRGKAIRKWANHYLKTKDLKETKRGCHRKIKSVIMDQDIRDQCLVALRQMPANARKPRTFMKALNEDILLQSNIAVGERTATRWMHLLGFSRTPNSKGIYYDGHERPDVVISRMQYLDAMLGYESRMRIYTDGSCKDMEIETNPLCTTQREVVILSHDESCFWANDDKKTQWTEVGVANSRRRIEERVL